MSGSDSLSSQPPAVAPPYHRSLCRPDGAHSEKARRRWGSAVLVGQRPAAVAARAARWLRRAGQPLELSSRTRDPGPDRGGRLPCAPGFPPRLRSRPGVTRGCGAIGERLHRPLVARARPSSMPNSMGRRFVQGDAAGQMTMPAEGSARFAGCPHPRFSASAICWQRLPSPCN